MPIFVNFTKASAFYRFFTPIIGFLWLFLTFIRVFVSKTFVFDQANISVFCHKKPADRTIGGFFMFFRLNRACPLGEQKARNHPHQLVQEHVGGGQQMHRAQQHQHQNHSHT